MVKMRAIVASLVAALLLVAGGSAVAKVGVDAALTPYKPTSGVSGNLSSVGSDTLNNLMTFWAELFAKYYPSAKIQIEGKGSSTAPPALISGTAQLGPMSREMKGTEIDQFEKKYGYKPTALRTSVDALAVFVNKDNPIKCLSLGQVDAIFSKSRRRGATGDLTTWGQLGLTGEWAGRPLSLYGRNSASGTYGFFKEHSLKNGDFKDSVKEQPGSASVVQGVTVDRFAIGYSGIGYATAGVRAVPLTEKDGGKCVEATADNAYSGTYPLARFLYVYVNKAPGKPLDPLVREFTRLVFSREGQEVVIKDGYFPVPASVAREELNKVL
jgi:phosphate transport system substrate-binding protein